MIVSSAILCCDAAFVRRAREEGLGPSRPTHLACALPPMPGSVRGGLKLGLGSSLGGNSDDETPAPPDRGGSDKGRSQQDLKLVFTNKKCGPCGTPESDDDPIAKALGKTEPRKWGYPPKVINGGLQNEGDSCYYCKRCLTLQIFKLSVRSKRMKE